MKKGKKLYLLFLLSTACVLLSGCVHMGSSTIPKDQFDYSTAIGDAKKQQILMNIVKLRYAEWPVFLEVYQVVAGYNWEQTGSATFSLRRIWNAADRDSALLGYNHKYVERPTITYSQLVGEHFVRSILTPARPETLLTLIEAGYPADRLFMAMVDSVNGKINKRYMYGTRYPADPAFIRFVQLLKKIHVANAFSIIVMEDEDHNTINELRFRPYLLDADIRAELQEVKNLLGLNLNEDSYRIAWGSVSEDPNTIAFRTRSVIQVMSAMAKYVEVPADEITDGGAMDYRIDSKEVEDNLPPLINIHSGTSVPESAFVAVRYHGLSFWIDANDRDSKLSLAYLTLLLTIAETGEIKGPQLTISAN